MPLLEVEQPKQPDELEAYYWARVCGGIGENKRDRRDPWRYRLLYQAASELPPKSVNDGRHKKNGKMFTFSDGSLFVLWPEHDYTIMTLKRGER